MSKRDTSNIKTATAGASLRANAGISSDQEPQVWASLFSPGNISREKEG